ncbi:MAG: hypothetical protein HY426_03635 [Candidatus Levybacteria bacterium]|nr:hypothetical protein [Candidatus Levybacteria bacterium]
MQNKQALIGIIAAAIILLGAGGVFLYSQNKPASNQPSTATQVGETQEEESGSMGSSLSELLALGKTQKCTFSYSDENGGTEGTVYINKGDMRGDMMIRTSADNKTMQMYMIRKGDDNYIWGGGFDAGTGLKMTLSAEDFSTNEDSKKYLDASKKVDYDCSGWTPDSTVFVPPSNIKFQDLSGMMQGALKTTDTTNSTGADCSVCNSLTGDAKNACMSSLGC